ncbi:MAG: ABC transporter ATP-binding protein [Bacillota bacterium]
MEVVVKAIGVHKTFQMGEVSLEVLKGIDLEIHAGEFVSIMGPSGSGKSTLLYLLGGLDKPTKGQILVLGQDISQMKDVDESRMRRRNVGFVFQFYNLIPNLSVEDNIMLPILLDGQKLKTYKETLDDILEVVGLADRRKHTPRELSGGQQQRVAIARALINQPEIVLADEPTGNLDSKTTTEILELFQKINREKQKTIVQVTHSRDAAEYGNRIIHVMDGKVWNS